MSLRAFRTLVAIARHRTFARAGEAIGLTQSAVSLQIKTLESEYNVQLFDRSRRQPVLTEAGNILLAQAEQVLALVDRIPDALSDEKKLVGRLRIGAIQTALSGPLPDALLALRAAHPRLRVHVSAGMSAELANRVAAGELDAAITTRPVRPHPAELTWTTLYEDRFWLLAPPDHAERDAVTLLDALPFIRFDAQAWAGMIAAELRRIGVRVREEMVLDSAETIVRMVARGRRGDRRTPRFDARTAAARHALAVRTAANGARGRPARTPVASGRAFRTCTGRGSHRVIDENFSLNT